MNVQECSICGEDHRDEAHGEPISIGDWAVRGLHLPDNMVDFALGEADSLGVDVSDLRLERIVGGESEDARLDAEVWVLDKIEERLFDAGYFAFSDSDAGSWFIYEAVKA